MLIFKFIGYVLIHLLNLSVPSALLLKTFNWLQVTFNWYMQGKQRTPGGMQGSKLIKLVFLSYPIYFRATSVYDMI